MKSLSIESLLLMFSSIILLFQFSCNTSEENEIVEYETAIDQWPEITKESKPWTRWWWMGSAVDKENIDYLLEEYERVGLGGVEIAPIYGAKGYEDRYLDFLSEEWIAVLNHTVSKASELNMGVDMTLGTGWPFGGPQVRMEHAASKMIVQEYDISEGQRDLEIVQRKRNEREPDAILINVIGIFKNGERKDLHDLRFGNVIENLPVGLEKVQALYFAKTEQKVKRAAPGGEGFTLDHFFRTAVNNYLESFDKAFDNAYPDIRSFYNDSFEVYGADFTADFLVEFEERRGYDLKMMLSELTDNTGDKKSIRVKSDYRETLHELLLENFTENWSAWAKDKGKKTKNQAHGSPGNLLDIYGAVDIPECETFGSSYFPIPGLRRDSADIRNVDPDPIMLKFASSAAHLTGKNLVSCETFTWLGEHFKSSFSQMKPELDQTFLAGINHVFYHGVTYSPQDVQFPGWLFYASLNLTQHNSLWEHFSEFNQYIARTQSVLQSGVPDNELLVYWPVYDVWANPKGMMELISVHHIDRWLHPTDFYKQSKQLMDLGYSVDFISDKMIAGSDIKNGEIKTHENANTAKALIIPKVEFMPLETLENILTLAKNGAKVIFQEKPKDIPGLQDLEEKREKFSTLWNETGLDKNTEVAWGKGKLILSKNIASSLEKEEIHREGISETGLKFIKRKIGSDKYYFIVNHSANTISQKVNFLTASENAIIMNPLNGKMGLAKSQRDGKYLGVALHLESGESLIVRTTNQKSEQIAGWGYHADPISNIEINSDWKITFDPNGGPNLPKDQKMDNLEPWTNQGDKDADFYSGQGTYSGSFEFELDQSLNYTLNFSSIHESAKVWINGKYVGQAWSLPYKLDVSEFLIQGKNDIKIEVANLMANHIRYLDINKIPWRNYHEINFVNIDYKPFDASSWNIMPSGLEGKLEIRGFNK
ncbi:glycoside hydrolase [Belliella sp. R4-6]|uniref:Glycoside hydrolase n=1 Tax=Belliella alkalica TaxID=1730871 RepID=A0ABS9VFC9_9BACT|nr:glycosyl hydrolase [Belliella alkalica]MCH7414548.1 glycoside hydrolase [Belliella alkalica]